MVEDMKKNLFRKMMTLGLAVLMMAALVGCGGSTGTEESQGGEQPAGDFNPEDYSGPARLPPGYVECRYPPERRRHPR